MYTSRYATEGVIRVIVGNKTDLPGRVVERKMVQWFVEEVRPLSLHGLRSVHSSGAPLQTGIAHFEASAMSGAGVEAAFRSVASAMLERRMQKQLRPQKFQSGKIMPGQPLMQDPAVPCYC